MKFTQTLTYPTTRAQVTDLIKNPEYSKQRWTDLQQQAEVDITTSEDRIRVSSTVEVSPSAIGQFQNLLNSGLNIKVMEVWDLDADGEVDRGTLSGSIAGVPVKFSMTMNVSTPAGEDSPTQVTLNGEVTCAIPFGAAGVEKAIVAHLGKAARYEEQHAEQFLH